MGRPRAYCVHPSGLLLSAQQLRYAIGVAGHRAAGRKGRLPKGWESALYLLLMWPSLLRSSECGRRLRRAAAARNGLRRRQPPYDVSRRDLICSSRCCVSCPQAERWAGDPNQYVADEEDDFSTVR